MNRRDCTPASLPGILGEPGSEEMFSLPSSEGQPCSLAVASAPSPFPMGRLPCLILSYFEGGTWGAG